MKKGEGTGLSIIISLIVIIIIITQYFIFFVIFPSETIELDSKQYIGSEIDLELITFTKLNSDLIIKSVNNNDYDELEKEITKLYLLGDCVNLKINNKLFRIEDCENRPGGQLGISSPINYQESIMNLPNYNNNPINIILKIKKWIKKEQFSCH